MDSGVSHYYVALGAPAQKLATLGKDTISLSTEP
jgi:hypothetical protein